MFRVWLAMLPVAIRIHLSGKGRVKGETALLMFDRSNNNCRERGRDPFIYDIHVNMGSVGEISHLGRSS